MQRHRPSLNQTARSQRGGMALTMMLVMLGLVLMLGLVEIGYLYWAKRDAQKTADLAALAGAQKIELCLQGIPGNEAAYASAKKQNAFPGTVQITCGIWDAANTAASDHFSATVPSGSAPNAVKVVASRSVIPFFGINENLPTVSAQAVARRAAPTAVFSVGSQLLRVNGNTPLGNVLRLVGADLDRTTLLGYDGLAQAKITPGGLLSALGIPVNVDAGVGELNSLLAGRTVKLGELLNATASALTQDGVVGVDLTALEGALVVDGIDLKQLDLRLGSETGGGGLFAKIVAPDGDVRSALNVGVDALNIIQTSILLANGGRAVAVNNLNILGLVQARAAVVEPPSIAIGSPHRGPDPNDYLKHNGARAYNAQVRVFVDIDTDNTALVGGLLKLLGTRLKVPLHVDVTNAHADLKALQCTPEIKTATFNVSSSVLRTCVGKVPENLRFSTSDMCETALENEDILKLLGTTVVHAKLPLDALTSTEYDFKVNEGETRSTDPNKLPIGTAISNLTSRLLGLLGQMLNSGSTSQAVDNSALQLADQYLAATQLSNGRYDVEKVVRVLGGQDTSTGLPPINDWLLKNNASALKTFEDTTLGRNGGLLGGLLNFLLGDLSASTCSGLLTQLLTYNNCVRRNLASFLQTNPAGIGNPGNASTPGTALSCGGLLCTVLQTALKPLKGILDGVGSLLSSTLANILGLELGRTDVHVDSIQCTNAQLVY